MKSYERCPKCDRIVGEWVTDGYSDSPIGKMGMAHQERNEYASNVAAHINRKYGMLCKDCARELFPDGKRYFVEITNGVYKGSILCVGGVDGDGAFADRNEARLKAKKMNDNHNGCEYRVITKGI